MHNKDFWLQTDSGLKKVLPSGFETSSSNGRNNLHVTSLTSQITAAVSINSFNEWKTAAKGFVSPSRKFFLLEVSLKPYPRNNVDQTWR